MIKKIKRQISNFYPFIVTNGKKKQINKIWKNTSEEEKEEIIKICKKYNETDKKIYKDVRYMRYTYGFKYEEYFIYRLKNKTLRKRLTFVSNKDMKGYIAYLNPAEKKKMLRDKYECYLKFKKFYKREMIKIETEEDFKAFSTFIKKHKKIVKKPYNKAFGSGIELIDTGKYKDKKELFKNLLSDGAVVLEELIIQSKEMKALHPSSVNTIRVIPYLKENGEVVIHNPFIKIGQKNSFVDNGGAGGILALIDEKTGVIKTDAYDENVKCYKVHPDTKVKIKGYQIPKWSEVIELAKELVVLTPDLKYIGWDMAYTPNGWVVVEGNGATQFIGQQLPDNKGKKKDMEKLICWGKNRK